MIFFSPVKLTVKCMEQDPQYNKILDRKNTIQESKLKICPDVRNKRHHATEAKCATNQQRCCRPQKSFKSGWQLNE